MSKRIGSLILAAVLCWAGAAMAAAPEVSVTLDRQTVLLGDAATLTVTVKGDNDPETPEVHPVPGFDLRFRGTRQESFSSMTVIIQGKTVRDNQSGGGYHFDFELIPQTAGTFNVPAILVDYKGKSYRTNALEFEVLEQSQQSDDIFIRISADREEVFLGEKVLLTFKWYLRKDFTGYDVRIPWLDGLKGFLVTDPEPDKGLRYHRLRINGNQEIAALKNREIHQGEQYTVIKFRKVLTPITTGVYEFEPAFLKCDVVTGYQQSRRGRRFDSFFDKSFEDFFGMAGRRAVTEPFSTRSNALKITVLGVPEEGQPDSFSGAVGRFDFNVDMKPVRLKAGDPVTVTMRVRGEGNIEELELPAFKEPEGFRSYEPEIRTQTKETNGRMLGERIFEKVLIPRASGRYEIPAIAFTYFNPDAKDYRTISSGPFALEVAEAPHEEEVHVIAMDTNGEEASVRKQGVELIRRDIRYIKTGLGQIGGNRRRLYENPLIWVFGILLPLVILLPLFLTQNRKERLSTDTEFRRYTQAMKRFNRGMKEASKFAAKNEARLFYDAMEKALTGYLSDKLNKPGGSVMAELFGDLRERGAEGDIVEGLAGLHRRAEMALYSSAASDAAVLKADAMLAAGFAARLERMLK